MTDDQISGTKQRNVRWGTGRFHGEIQEDRPVALTARASDSKSEGWGFKSLLACHFDGKASVRTDPVGTGKEEEVTRGGNGSEPASFGA